MIDYSIIIPHKNTPQLLRKCLDSIPKREDVQIIVVDDNSDSDKVDFNDFPGVGEPHTEVYFTKEGRGAGYARNVGLGKATGKWIVFADADDYFMPEFNEALDYYISSDYDVIYLKSDTVGTGGVITPMEDNEYIDYARASGDYTRVKFWMTVPWGRFYRRDYIVRNGILFEEIRWSNDVMFVIKAGLWTDKVGVSDFLIYRSDRRYSSLRHKNSLQSNEVRLLADCRSFDLLKEYNQYESIKPVVGCTMHYWTLIFYEDKLKAIRLLPKVIRTMGWNCWLGEVNRNKRRLIKSFWR